MRPAIDGNLEANDAPAPLDLDADVLRMKCCRRAPVSIFAMIGPMPSSGRRTRSRHPINGGVLPESVCACVMLRF